MSSPQTTALHAQREERRGKQDSGRHHKESIFIYIFFFHQQKSNYDTAPANWATARYLALTREKQGEMKNQTLGAMERRTRRTTCRKEQQSERNAEIDNPNTHPEIHQHLNRTTKRCCMVFLAGKMDRSYLIFLNKFVKIKAFGFTAKSMLG